jgi:hypothetical protein
MVVAILKEVMIIPYQWEDVSLTDENSEFKLVEIPSSLRGVLSQISTSAYFAFVTADLNLNGIKTAYEYILVKLESVTKFLMTRNPERISKTLLGDLNSISSATSRSLILSVQTEEKFTMTIDLVKKVKSVLSNALSSQEKNLKNTDEQINGTQKNILEKIKKQEKIETLLSDLRNLEEEKTSIREKILVIRTSTFLLSDLVNHLTDLVHFFQAFSDPGQKACQRIHDLIETTGDDPQQFSDADLINEILLNIKTADQASVLVRELTAMYVEITRKYVTDELARLPKINGINKADLELEKKRVKERSDLALEEVDNLLSSRLESLSIQMAQREKELDERYKFIKEGEF